MRSLTKIMSIFGLVIEIKHLQKITLTWQLFFPLKCLLSYVAFDAS